ncbi:hypothetical protein [Actinokineospora sp. NBRC 105648]|uniref:rolling circle replication-associated protein n=1 Tax=Actinokineospora sp. NBRC 105648 TaxID=3032206 RepID=UPI0025524ADD|nr:hypothetical protein [Actinokineospora sp. NBRC 105648]
MQTSHASPPIDTRSAALTGQLDAAELIASVWRPDFPTREMVRQAADLVPLIPRDTSTASVLAEGPRPLLRIAPGVIALRGRDDARAERTAERQVHRREVDVDLLAAEIARSGSLPEDRESTREITEWSRKSQLNMMVTFAELDYEPMFADPLRMPAMMTVTYPGKWEIVAPNGRAVKAHMKRLRKRYERQWGEKLRCLWKLEFQRRGAPHVHFLMVPPHGMAGSRNFREWLSWVWADIVAHPDPVERAKHERAGTGVDYSEPLKSRDPKRMAVYFAKHSQFKDKAYQNIVPELWQEPGQGPGRFWGAWRLEKSVEIRQLDPRTDDDLVIGRTLRGHARAAGTTREVTKPRVRGGRVISKYPEVQGLAGAWLIASRPAPRYRRTRVRVNRMAKNRGFVITNNAPALFAEIARHPGLSWNSVDQ